MQDNVIIRRMSLHQELRLGEGQGVESEVSNC